MKMLILSIVVLVICIAINAHINNLIGNPNDGNDGYMRVTFTSKTADWVPIGWGYSEDGE